MQSSRKKKASKQLKRAKVMSKNFMLKAHKDKQHERNFIDMTVKSAFRE